MGEILGKGEKLLFIVAFLDLQLVEDRKPANYVYTQIQYMYVFPIFSCKRDEEQTKIQPMKEKMKPKPMERQPRYDRW